jgi:hypothetical protein
MASESSKAVPGEERRRGPGVGAPRTAAPSTGPLYRLCSVLRASYVVWVVVWVSVGFGVAATPWRAVQIAGRAAAGREAPE